MKTVVSHFYNEEYLLPWWLNHHKKVFDYGIMINYASTDRSVEIIKEICPHWLVVDSVFEEFDAILLDQEVMHYESQVPGWKICLNIPEFLYGDYSVLNDDPTPQEHYIPSFYFVDPNENTIADPNIPLHEQFKFGLDYRDNLGGIHPQKGNKSYRHWRVIHNHAIQYTPGRHFGSGPEDPHFAVFYYNLAPFNESMIQRKLQIQTRLSDRFKDQHHKMNKDELFSDREKYFLPFSVDLSSDIDHFVNLTGI
jgi:hypothetical protein